MATRAHSRKSKLLVVQPPLKVCSVNEGDENDFSEENNNPYKLKKCSIHLRKLACIERALALGCTTVLIPPNIH